MVSDHLASIRLLLLVLIFAIGPSVLPYHHLIPTPRNATPKLPSCFPSVSDSNESSLRAPRPGLSAGRRASSGDPIAQRTAVCQSRQTRRGFLASRLDQKSVHPIAQDWRNSDRTGKSKPAALPSGYCFHALLSRQTRQALLLSLPNRPRNAGGGRRSYAQLLLPKGRSRRWARASRLGMWLGFTLPLSGGEVSELSDHSFVQFQDAKTPHRLDHCLAWLQEPPRRHGRRQRLPLPALVFR